MPTKKLTEANCHPRYSCSKLSLIDAIFIWFSDRQNAVYINYTKKLEYGIWCSEE